MTSTVEAAGVRLPATGLHVLGEARAAVGGGTFEVLDPSTGQALARVADASPDDVDPAVAAAASALRTWSRSAPGARAQVLERAAALLLERTEELAALISAESGKSLRDARGEIRYSADFFRWYAGEALRLDGVSRRSPSGDYWILTRQEPIGVVAVVTPWNFPAAMIARKVAPAVAAGCTCVVKPPEEAPLTSLALAALLEEAGLPAGVVNVLPTADAPRVVARLLEHPAVRKISFTGSTEVGRRLLRASAERVLATSMELGGNAPFIVFDDADLDDAVQGALAAKMRGCGQACTAANRFLVHEDIADEFTARLVRVMAALRPGSASAEETEVGPLVSARARDGVHRLVRGAIGRGARLALGGELPEGAGYHYPPTVLDHVAPDDPLVTTEIFGPVAAVVRFSTEAQAVDLANDSEMGLASYVFSRDLARALRVADALEVGMVGINRGLVSDAAAPFGGTKQSGLGREGGSEGVQEYLETKYIAVDW
ncbi:aldehyde dehydrogenase family protein [Nocardioides sp. zg-579]|uniref:Aldehyde dehydrogenase family protein n=1 Tax=Nocardioides marmotae TaxID=2663857 RepID=A0A6I3J912_9ACTN|nr:NAD-dependent succinate-semialdehyde dehydrogenase [Nocardioides marmotae]MCR6030258.1 aldehyde dehydrogenase family protein [Gordonia jinghuaiqii]MTB93890.1 aldehyde dehydrogenase family protein [Nocardioides marmotae]QKE00213.1 NAD-dependent succinate-semialdehyde dehydrogenase [Nocardioides marmotae]